MGSGTQWVDVMHYHQSGGFGYTTGPRIIGVAFFPPEKSLMLIDSNSFYSARTGGHLGRYVME